MTGPPRTRRLLVAVLVADDPERALNHDGEERYSVRLNRFRRYVMRLRPVSGEHLFDATEVDDARSCDLLLAEMMAVVQPLDRDILCVFDTGDITPGTGAGGEEYEELTFVGYDLLQGEWHREELLGIYLEGLADDGRLRRALNNNKFVVRRRRPRYEVEGMLASAAGGAENINVLVRDLTGVAAIYCRGALWTATNGRELAAVLAAIESGR